MQTKLLLIGNGSIAKDVESGKHYSNGNTVALVNQLNQLNFFVTYVEPQSAYSKHTNLLNSSLEDFDIQFRALNTQSIIHKCLAILKILFIALQVQFVYLFLPGTLGKIIGCSLGFIGKKYGIYVRGNFSDNDKVLQYIFQKAAFILTVSPLLEQQLKFYNKNVECIRPMINFGISDLNLKASISQEPPSWKFLYVGNLSKGKGLFEMMDVIQYLNAKGIKSEWRIVGGGELYHSLVTQQENGQLPGNITFTGLISAKNDLIDEYRRADLFFFPTHTEGFARTLIEAMSQGLPIFTTIVGGIGGYMKDNVNCIEIPVMDAVKQAEIVIQYLANHITVNRVAANGYDTVKGILEKRECHEKLIQKKYNELV